MAFLWEARGAERIKKEVGNTKVELNKARIGIIFGEIEIELN